ncbi:MAG: CBS domain-containing protein [Chloroflexi bacterium]|nr:CBS domain-containing protein [Chloroflexota bacterium]
MTTKVLAGRAAEIMSSPVVTIGAGAKLAEAARLMVERNIGCLPVIDTNGALIGMLTERALQAQLAGSRPLSNLSFQERTVLELYSGHPGQIDPSGPDLRELRRREVRQVMVNEPVTVDVAAPIWQVADAMLRSHVSYVAVTRGGRLAGLVARHDLIRALAGR